MLKSTAALLTLSILILFAVYTGPIELISEIERAEKSDTFNQSPRLLTISGVGLVVEGEPTVREVQGRAVAQVSGGSFSCRCTGVDTSNEGESGGYCNPVLVAGKPDCARVECTKCTRDTIVSKSVVVVMDANIKQLQKSLELDTLDSAESVLVIRAWDGKPVTKSCGATGKSKATELTENAMKRLLSPLPLRSSDDAVFPIVIDAFEHGQLVRQSLFAGNFEAAAMLLDLPVAAIGIPTKAASVSAAGSPTCGCSTDGECELKTAGDAVWCESEDCHAVLEGVCSLSHDAQK